MESFIERTLDKNVKSMRVTLDEVNKSSGARTQRLVIHYPNAVAIIPYLGDGKFLVVDQYRYALQRKTTEFPAGKIDPGETPEDAVIRELMEETGYIAKTVKKIYTYAPAMGYSTEILYMYFVTDLEKSMSSNVDPDEIENVQIMTKQELWKGIQQETLQDPKIGIGLLFCEKMNLI